MNVRFVILFFFLSFQYLQAQESPNIQFGLPNRDELELKYAPNDSSAEAIMLFDKCDVLVNDGYDEIVKVSHQRIKILRPSALWRANIELRAGKIGNEFEKINEIEAFVYNLEGTEIKITKYDATQIFEEKASDRLVLKKIILPNVKVGSVIEYRYKLTVPFLVSNASNRWNFQDDIPVDWSEINITAPEDAPLSFQHHGYLPYYIQSKSDAVGLLGIKTGIKHRFVIKHAPAFHLEHYMTTHKDYLANLDYGILSHESNRTEASPAANWEQILTFFYNKNRFQSQSISTGYLSKVAKDLKTIKDVNARLQAAFNFMTENFTWNNIASVFAKEELSLVFEKKSGNSAELNLLFVLLLNKIGIEAQSVLLSTRDNGEFDVLKPLAQNFNHTIAHAKLDGQAIFMDVTNPFSRPNVLPFMCLNKKFCVLYTDSVQLVNFEPKKSVELTMIEAQLDTLGNITAATYAHTAGGFYAAMLRRRLKLEQEQTILKGIEAATPDWEIRDFKIDVSNPETVKLNYNFSERDTNTFANRLVLSPMLSEKMVNHNFKDPKRLYPVDFGYAFENISIVKFTIPKQFIVHYLPENAVVKLPNNGGKFSYIIEVGEGSIQIKSHMVLNHASYSPEEYKALKKMYDTKLMKHAEQIVLKTM